MKTPNALTTRLIVLALIIVFGPLKASAAFACEMMETVVHEVCCCDEAGASRDSSDEDEGCDDQVTWTSPSPCCEQSTTVSIDADDYKATPAQKAGSKLGEAGFDIDPPDTVAVDSRVGGLLPPPFSGHAVPAATRAHPGDGSTLWLTTRRLRI